LNPISLTHHFIYHLKRLYFNGFFYQRKYHRDRLMFDLSNAKSSKSSNENILKSITAITVSVNYAQVLALVIEKNISFFSEWIIVTDPKDSATIDLLEEYPEINTIFFNFKKNGNKFNKGGAIRKAQKYAYRVSPSNWYLLIDSDIIIRNPLALSYLDELDESAMYVCHDRRDYSSLSDLNSGKNYKFYESSMRAGYFQLYRKKHFYTDWPDASTCDVVFGSHFAIIRNLPGIACNHLGQEGNHDGSKGPKFQFDS